MREMVGEKTAQRSGALTTRARARARVLRCAARARACVRCQSPALSLSLQGPRSPLIIGISHVFVKNGGGWLAAAASLCADRAISFPALVPS